MEDQELIDRARVVLEEGGAKLGGFWIITGSETIDPTVWFWGDPPGCPNYYCQFDKDSGAVWQCNAPNRGRL